jgi:hypothetical protein
MDEESLTRVKSSRPDGGPEDFDTHRVGKMKKKKKKNRWRGHDFLRREKCSRGW